MVDKGILIALFYTTVAAALGITNARRLKKLNEETKTWVTTRGRVLEAKLVGWGKTRRAQILYEFHAPAKIVGSQICAHGCEESDPNVYIRWYRVGKEIHIHYNPANPQQCLLELPKERTIKGWNLLAAIGLIFPFLYLLWLEYLKSWTVD